MTQKARGEIQTVQRKFKYFPLYSAYYLTDSRAWIMQDVEMTCHEQVSVESSLFFSASVREVFIFHCLEGYCLII
jgi:hypothetical protein